MCTVVQLDTFLACLVTCHGNRTWPKEIPWQLVLYSLQVSACSSKVCTRTSGTCLRIRQLKTTARLINPITVLQYNRFTLQPCTYIPTKRPSKGYIPAIRIHAFLLYTYEYNQNPGYVCDVDDTWVDTGTKATTACSMYYKEPCVATAMSSDSS